MNANGIDTMPGLDSGNQSKLAPGIIDVFVPDTAGEKMISTIKGSARRTCSTARRGC